MTYPVSESVKRWPCKCGHLQGEHVLSPDLTEQEPCSQCDCGDYWADFDH